MNLVETHPITQYIYSIYKSDYGGHDNDHDRASAKDVDDNYYDHDNGNDYDYSSHHNCSAYHIHLLKSDHESDVPSISKPFLKCFHQKCTHLQYLSVSLYRGSPEYNSPTNDWTQETRIKHATYTQRFDKARERLVRNKNISYLLIEFEAHKKRIYSAHMRHWNVVHRQVSFGSISSGA